MRSNRLLIKVDKEYLPQIKDRYPFLYLERGRLEVDDSSVKWIDSEGRVIPLPIATIQSLLLGPGTSITHEAVKADLILCLLPPVGMTMLGIDYYTGSLWTYNDVNAVLERKIDLSPRKLPDIIRPLMPETENYIRNNFNRLKEEAFSSTSSQERIRTLASMAGVDMSRLIGMISEAQNSEELIDFLKNN